MTRRAGAKLFSKSNTGSPAASWDRGGRATIDNLGGKNVKFVEICKIKSVRILKT